MKIYTKTGDLGETSLFDGTRVLKNNERVSCYGDVDELNSVLGVALSFINHETVRSFLLEIQRDLFALGAGLANPKHKKQKEKADFNETKVAALEKAIDEIEKQIDPIKNFILPGGSQASSFLDLARTVCRRAERKVVELKTREEVDSLFVVYLNRLSDYLFMLSRFVNKKEGYKDIIWS